MLSKLCDRRSLSTIRWTNLLRSSEHGKRRDTTDDVQFVLLSDDQGVSKSASYQP